jgi:hypothetical protein
VPCEDIVVEESHIENTLQIGVSSSFFDQAGKVTCGHSFLASEISFDDYLRQKKEPSDTGDIDLISRQDLNLKTKQANPKRDLY